MANRLAVLALAIAAIAQVLNLVALPSESVQTSLAFWKHVRSEAEALDPSKSQHPASAAKTRADVLQAADAVLANPDGLLVGARIHYMLWLASFLLTTLAIFALVLRWRRWPLVAIVAAGIFFWLQPLTALRLFNVDGRFDVAHGVSQLALMSHHAGPFWTMIVLSALVPALFVAVVVYGLHHGYRVWREKDAANAP
jgi:hypothetical protein